MQSKPGWRYCDDPKFVTLIKKMFIEEKKNGEGTSNHLTAAKWKEKMLARKTITSGKR
jgi:hypothetical protein